MREHRADPEFADQDAIEARLGSKGSQSCDAPTSQSILQLSGKNPRLISCFSYRRANDEQSHRKYRDGKQRQSNHKQTGDWFGSP